MNTVLEEALKLIENGYSVFPVDPAEGNNFDRSYCLKLATDDPAHVAELFRKYPTANLAISLVSTGHWALTLNCDEALMRFVDLWGYETPDCTCYARFAKDRSLAHKGNCHSILHDSTSKKPVSPLLLSPEGYTYIFKGHPNYPHDPLRKYDRIGFVRVEAVAILVEPSTVNGDSYEWADCCSPFDVDPPLLSTHIQEGLRRLPLSGGVDMKTTSHDTAQFFPSTIRKHDDQSIACCDGSGGLLGVLRCPLPFMEILQLKGTELLTDEDNQPIVKLFPHVDTEEYAYQLETLLLLSGNPLGNSFLPMQVKQQGERLEVHNFNNELIICQQSKLSFGCLLGYLGFTSPQEISVSEAFLIGHGEFDTQRGWFNSRGWHQYVRRVYRLQSFIRDIQASGDANQETNK